MAAGVPKTDTGGGGDMEDVLKRLGALETSASEIKAQVSGLSATVVHLATKSDLAEVRAELKSDMADLKGEVKTLVAQVESSLIKWFVATSLAAISMAFVIARYVTP